MTEPNGKLTVFVTCIVLLLGSFPFSGCFVKPIQAELCTLQTVGLIRAVYLVHNQLGLRDIATGLYISQGLVFVCIPFSVQKCLVIQLYFVSNTGVGFVGVLQHQCALVGNSKLHGVGVDAGCIHMAGIMEGVFVAGQGIAKGSVCGIIELNRI